jgi:hypothetical protein
MVAHLDAYIVTLELWRAERKKRERRAYLVIAESWEDALRLSHDAGQSIWGLGEKDVQVDSAVILPLAGHVQNYVRGLVSGVDIALGDVI